MVKPKFRTTWPWELAKELTETFIDCVNRFEKGNWEPEWIGELSKKNFLHFQNGKDIDIRFGTQGFMRSVGLEADIFLEGISETGFYTKSSEIKYNAFNKTGNMQILQLSQFTNSMCRTAEKILENNSSLLSDSLTIRSIRKGKKSDRIFTGGTKFNTMGVETPEEKEMTAKFREVQIREEQPKFREGILEKYNGTCVVTDCTIKSALDAAHIIPVRHGGNYKLKNGLLLRADLHRLFDAYLMAIDPDTGKVHFKKTGEHYNKYAQKFVDILKNNISRENLKNHWNKFKGKSEKK